jgi:hypothetical protein
MVGTEPADRSGRDADHGAGLAVPRALAVRARADVDRILQYAGYAAVVFGRHEQQRVGARNALLERGDLGGRTGFEILVEQRQLADLDDFELQRRRRHRGERLGHFPVERFLAQAADDDGDVAGRAHGVPFVLGRPTRTDHLPVRIYFVRCGGTTTSVALSISFSAELSIDSACSIRPAANSSLTSTISWRSFCS